MRKFLLIFILVALVFVAFPGKALTESEASTVQAIQTLINNIQQQMTQLQTLVTQLAGQPSTPTITVTSPNGGETWQVGTAHSITWSSQGLTAGDILNIYLISAGQTPYIIASSVSPTVNSYIWTIPTTISAGTNYKIEVYDAKTGVVLQDLSDNYFTITSSTQPSVTVTSPNGGEVWKVGETHTITWITSLYDASGIVDLQLCDASALNGVGLCSEFTNPPVVNNGNYSWTIPQQLGGLILGNGNVYKVEARIFPDGLGGSAKIDYSDANFSISTTSSCTPNWQCSDWSTCKNNQQTKTCTDANNCGVLTDRPALSQSCIDVPPSENCTDSDSGLDYNHKGSITVNTKYGTKIGRTDACAGSNNTYVTEYYCDATSSSGYGYEYYNCQYGCLDGSCRENANNKPSVTVVSPNGGGAFFTGGSIQAVLSGTGFDDANINPMNVNSVTLSLLNYDTSSGAPETITNFTGIPLSGGVITIPSYVKSGTKYKLSATCMYSRCYGDESDGYFIISRASTAAPVITSISLDHAAQNDPSFTIDVYGTGFTSGSSIKFDNWDITTSPTLFSTTHLQTIVTSLKYISVGAHPVFVVNPDGQASNSISFNVTASTATPAITSISPNSVGQNITKTIDIYGTNFSAGSVVMINNSREKTMNTTFISPSHIQTMITTSSNYGNYLAAGTYNISIEGAGGTGYSNYMPFTVTAQASYNPLGIIENQIASLMDAIKKILGY